MYLKTFLRRHKPVYGFATSDFYFVQEIRKYNGCHYLYILAIQGLRPNLAMLAVISLFLPTSISWILPVTSNIMMCLVKFKNIHFIFTYLLVTLNLSYRYLHM